MRLLLAKQVGGGAPLIAVVDEGGELRDGSLAVTDVRIGLFFGDRGLDGVTSEGVAVFDGAVRYALGDTDGGPALQPGDADQDLDFDQLDIVKVQIAAKYLTGQARHLGRRRLGWWRRAAARAARRRQRQVRPTGIVVATSAGKYLAGPYAAIVPRGQR